MLELIVEGTTGSLLGVGLIIGFIAGALAEAWVRSEARLRTFRRVRHDR